MTIDGELQGQVDAQLLEQGSFTVMDFLLDSGRLLPDDYERWRRGELGSLDDVLMGSTQKIRAELESTAAYARKIGLVQDQQTFHCWGSDATAGTDPLLVSTDATLRRLIASRFVRAQNAPQLDLFFDNPVVALTNGIVRALSAANGVETQRLLDLLYAQAPNHADLAAYDRLLAALSHRDQPIDDPRRELSFLLQVQPIAKRLMGSQARDLLTPLWRQLAEALGGHAFQPAEPDLHTSFCLCQAQDWEGASRAVRDAPQWWLHAALCLRLAQSRFHLRDRSGALTAWFQLCWHAPSEAAEALDRRHPDVGIAASWRRFVDSDDEGTVGTPGGDGAAVDGAGADATLGAGDFPAWLLLQEPGLTQQLSIDLATGDAASQESYRIVHRWIDARRAGRDGEEMALRKSLQATNRALFACLKRAV
jgi:hypothetical protein